MGGCTGSRNEVSVKLAVLQAETKNRHNVLPELWDDLKGYFAYSLLTVLCPSPLFQVFMEICLLCKGLSLRT